MLKIGNPYNRRQIHDLVGGGVQSYLPHKNGQVVCGCFRKDLNPFAPDIILPGKGPEIMRWAKAFREQTYPIPIFIKKYSNSWEYVGNYKVERWTSDMAEIAKYAEYTGRNTITSILFLKNE